MISTEKEIQVLGITSFLLKLLNTY